MSCEYRLRINKNAETQSWKQRPGSLSHRAGLHGHERELRPSPDKPEMIALIRAAVDRGVTFFDTAEVYGRSPMKSWWARHWRRSVTRCDRHKVRLRFRNRRVPGPEQPPRAHQAGREGSLKRLNMD